MSKNLMWVPGSQEWKPIVEPCVYVWRADSNDSDAIAFDVDDIEEAAVEWCDKYWECSSSYAGEPQRLKARYGANGPIVEVRVDVEWEPVFAARVVEETEPNTPQGPEYRKTR